MLPSDLKLITKADAAEAFSVSVKTIDNYIKDGKLPPPTLFVSKEIGIRRTSVGSLNRPFGDNPRGLRTRLKPKLKLVWSAQSPRRPECRRAVRQRTATLQFGNGPAKRSCSVA